MKIWKKIAPNEVVSIGELFKRCYGKSGEYYEIEIFFYHTVMDCKKLEVLGSTRSEPYRVTREKTFFEKMLDKIK